MSKDMRTISFWFDAFLLDRRVRQVSPGTMRFYFQKLKAFADWCTKEGVSTIYELNPNHIRLFLVWLEENGNNAGGRHAYYRSLRSFLNFFEDEAEPENYKNPIKKVSAPRVPERPINPVSIDQVSRLVQACDTKTFYGCRDKAIFMLLLDTGVRASELLGVDIEDVNLIEGSIQVRKGKGNKVRTVFFGKKAKKVVRCWLRKRSHNAIPLFTTMGNDRLKYSGLVQILRRKSKSVGITGVTIHDFRRAHCLGLLQAGVPETSIARFMGHANTSLISTYAKQSNQNLQEVYHSISDSEL